LNFADFDSQGLFNNFSGDSGAFASEQAKISGAFDSTVFHGTNGASLRIDYAVPIGFCGIWNSLLSKASHASHSLNFTNLYDGLHNSADNPSQIENVRLTNFSFWARGEGKGNFLHNVRVELKSTENLVAGTNFLISDAAQWMQYNLPLEDFGTNDVSKMKELVFVIEDWRNSNRVGTVYFDDLTFSTDERSYDPSSWSDDALLDVVSQRAFGYFLRFTDDLGFALDRSTFSDMVSVGTIGFQLTAYCIGHQRGWADRQGLENRVASILDNLNKVPMGPEPGTVNGGYHGFYYHFLAANTGRRKDENVELSLYDTMLLMYGVLACREYFPANEQIQSLSRQLFDRVEWDWFVDTSSTSNRNQFYLAWIPGPQKKGSFYRHVDGQTDEALMLDILALGSSTHPVSLKTYLARNRLFSTYPDGSSTPIMVSWRGSLFNYFFASCWLDFASRGIDLHPTHPQNLWQNNLRAIVANRQFCIDHRSSRLNDTNDLYASYSDRSWGLTACDNLVEPGPGAGEYFSFGSLPTEENVKFGTRALHAGTIAVYGAAGSINYLPTESVAALRYYFQIPKLWSPLFGFGDAFSLDPHYLGSPYDVDGNPTIHFADYLNGPWVNTMVMGINVGPMLLAIENARSHQIWDLMARNPEITAGLDTIFGIGSPETETITNQNDNQTTITLRWKPQPGASKYLIFASSDSENWFLLHNGVKGTDWTDDQPNAESHKYYLVKAVRQ
jgi:hypothetical protein